MTLLIYLLSMCLLGVPLEVLLKVLRGVESLRIMNES